MKPLAATAALALLAVAVPASPEPAPPAIRPPAVPLFVRSPYLSVWSSADGIIGRPLSFWTGAPKDLKGIATIDGRPYVFMGSAADTEPALRQIALRVTATQSIYTLRGGGIALTLDFLSPVEAHDVRRLSMPFAYLFVGAKSADGRPHRIALDWTVSGSWAPNVKAGAIWTATRIADGKQHLATLTVRSANPRPLGENGDYATWGSYVFVAPPGASTGMTQSAYERIYETPASVASPGSVATLPSGSIEVNLGTVGSGSRARATTLMIGEVRDPDVSYLGKPLPALWHSYWPSWQQMAAFAFGDANAARARADTLDARILRQALRAGGPHYAALCALTLRQAFGAVELVGTKQRPWMFLKEISSDGNVSSVDVVYPAFPAYVYANPAVARLLLAPLLAYAERGGWPKVFAEHDIGRSYPNAAGHNDGKEEDMPVEESGNMLIMIDAYAREVAPSVARAYVRRHYRILKQWGDYEVANATDPAYQNQTDDFTGFIKSSANLALKGILSVGAMAQLAHDAGYDADAARYDRDARSMIARWLTLAQSKTGDHLVLAYGQDATWSLKYNAIADRWLRLHLVPHRVMTMEARYYLQHTDRFGIPLDNRHTYTKADWELWTAVAMGNARLRKTIIDDVYRFANESHTRTPLSDWYDAVSGEPVGFTARPVMGATYVLLLTSR